MARKHGLWTISETNVKYENPWMRVEEHRGLQPDGKPGLHAVVRMRGGVSVLPLDENGFAYLTDEFHFAVGRNTIEAVSGALDAGEEPLQAAERERREELGIEAGEWTDLGNVDPLTSVVVCPARLFLARKLRFGRASQEGTETIRQVKVPFKEAVRMVVESEITHGPSCTLILKANEYLKTKAPHSRGLQTTA